MGAHAPGTAPARLGSAAELGRGGRGGGGRRRRGPYGYRRKSEHRSRDRRNPGSKGTKECRGGHLPAENPLGPRLNQQRAGEHDPVHEPWRQLGGVRRLERLVRGEDWEEDRCDGAVFGGFFFMSEEARIEQLASKRPPCIAGIAQARAGQGGVTTHDKSLGSRSNMAAIVDRESPGPFEFPVVSSDAVFCSSFVYRETRSLKRLGSRALWSR